MEATNIKDLFARSGSYIIPSYQRAYSWETRQLDQLIEDLRDISGKYYFGHFLFETPEDTKEKYLIDGQQRLTTVVIFFSCIRKALLKYSGDESINLKCKYISDHYLREPYEDRPHLYTVENDRTFFIHEIIDGDEFFSDGELRSSSQKRIRGCRTYFDEVFAKEKKETLLKWIEIIEEAKVTEYHVTKKAEAAQIFAFQNDRGKPLSNLEVLKSYFMLQIYLRSGKKQDDFIQELNDSFRNIYESIVLTDTKEDDILRYFWMAYSKYGYNTDHPLNEIKSSFKNKEIEEITLFVRQLSRAFSFIISIEKDDNFDLMNLRRLNRMAQSYPILLKSKVIAKVEDRTYYRLVRLLENVTFRAAARGGRAAIETRLNNILINANDDSSFNTQINTFVANIPYEYWSDKELKNAISSGGIYFNHRVCAYLLWRYEQSLCPPNHPATRVVWEDIMKKESLEHIAPQTPVDEERAHGYGIYRDIEHPDNGIESGEWLNSIGNMLLLSQSQNSAAGNRDLIDKLRIYEKENSLIRQQQEVCRFMKDPDHPFWDKDCIERRGNHIIETAMSIWDINKI